jgi:hypothetical protein
VTSARQERSRFVLLTIFCHNLAANHVWTELKHINNTLAVLSQEVRVDHRHFEVGMPNNLGHCEDVPARRDEMARESMPEQVRCQAVNSGGLAHAKEMVVDAVSD